MVDPTVPLAQRSMRFAAHTFQDMARTGDVTECRNQARKAREEATTSAHPLLCRARGAWWDTVADHCIQHRAAVP